MRFLILSYVSLSYVLWPLYSDRPGQPRIEPWCRLRARWLLLAVADESWWSWVLAVVSARVRLNTKHDNPRAWPGHGLTDAGRAEIWFNWTLNETHITVYYRVGGMHITLPSARRFTASSGGQNYFVERTYMWNDKSFKCIIRLSLIHLSERKEIDRRKL